MSRRNARANHVSAPGGYDHAPLGGGGWPICGSGRTLADEWAEEQANFRPAFRDREADIVPLSAVVGSANGVEGGGAPSRSGNVRSGKGGGDNGQRFSEGNRSAQEEARRALLKLKEGIARNQELAVELAELVDRIRHID